jgi:hypothetical protein
MEILLALAAAVSYGVSDFAGGVRTRRAHVFVVFLLSQLVSTSSIAFLCALEPQPVLDFETRRPRADENGEPRSSLWPGQMSNASATMPGCSQIRGRSTAERASDLGWS